MADSPVLYVYYRPDNDDSYPGVPNRHITEADWASFTIAQRRTVEHATTQEGYTRRKVWLHRDLVDETEQERADREAAEQAAREAYDRANSLVRYGQIEAMIDQLEVLPPAEEFAALRADVDAVADVPPRVEAVETKVARVDPGASGAVGQTLTVGPSGPVWLDEPVFNVRHPRFGATGVEAHDQTAAVQAAINAAQAAGGGTVYFPAGTYTVTGVTVTGPGIRFEGVSRAKSFLRGIGANPTITLTNASHFNCEHMRLLAHSAHVIHSTTSMVYTYWHDLTINQFSANHSVLNCDDQDIETFDYIDNVWSHVDTTHASAGNPATVPTFNIRGVAVNRNTFTDMRPTYSGNYTWRLESSANAAYASGNVFRGITGEVLNGGIIQLLGCRGVLIENVEVYDMTTSTRDLFDIGNSTVTTNLSSIGVTFIACRRVGGTLGAGLYDVNLGQSTTTTGAVFINCGFNPTGFYINANSRYCVVIDGDKVEVANDNNTMYLRPSNSKFPGPVRLWARTTAQRPDAATAGAGAMIYDTTLGKPIYSNGMAWTDATGTVV